MQSSGKWFTDKNEKTEILASIRSNNLGQALKGLGYPGSLQGGNLDAKLEAEWSGSLEDFSFLNAKGDLDLESPASLLVGYRHLKEWCCGNLQLSDSISMSIKATKNLAKRQLTWLRGWDDLQSVSIDFDDRLLTIDELENKVSKMVEEHLLL